VGKKGIKHARQENQEEGKKQHPRRKENCEMKAKRIKDSWTTCSNLPDSKREKKEVWKPEKKSDKIR